MAAIYEKDGNALKVTVEETKTTVASFDMAFLKSQKASIEADIVRNQAELAKVDELIAQAEGLGVTDDAAAIAVP